MVVVTLFLRVAFRMVVGVLCCGGGGICGIVLVGVVMVVYLR